MVKAKLMTVTWWAVRVEDKECSHGWRQILVEANSALEANEMMADYCVVGMEQIKVELMRKEEE